jgi:hypothetical protein
MPNLRSLARTALLTGVLLLTKGCTSLPPQRTAELPAREAACAAQLARIDLQIEADGATDGAAFRIEGFPYLRTNRFLQAAGARVITRNQTLAWLEAMHALDLESRRKEIQNLSAPRLPKLVAAAQGALDRETLLQGAVQCSETLFAYHRHETDLRERVHRQTSIPEEYQTWRRLVGLYPLASLPVAYVTDSVYDDFRQWHATPPDDLPRKGHLVTFGPGPADAPARFDPRPLFRAERLNALGIPRMTAEERRRLAAHFAPVITQDQAHDFDRIGTPVWRGGRVRVATDQATVYYYFSHGLIAGRPVVQINYAFWYSRRDGDNAPWIERGPLDGITVRISLDHRAQPFMVDLMNNCGCYHFFIPARTCVRAVREIALEVDPLVPAWLPPDFPAKRLLLRANSGWHQVQHVGTAPESAPRQEYVLTPYEQLEMLPDETGRTRSIFDADGIARDSERIEPLIFFSMGIPAVGSMRQRGHHAIKLVGRAYFDDPLLFEQSFDLHPACFEDAVPGQANLE